MKKAVIIINIAVIVTLLILSTILMVRSSSLPEQQANLRWSNEDSQFSQVSVFYQSGISFDQSYQLSYDIEEKAKSYVKNSPGELVASAFTSAPKSFNFTAKTDIGEKSANLESYFVGGNFLLFHPYELLTGTFLNDDTIMRDNAVIDENAAWQLFGSNDVADEYIFYGSNPIHISGVVRIPDADKGYIFLDKELSETIENKQAEFSCLEVVLPNPVAGQGFTIVKEQLGITDGNVNAAKTVRVVENSNRTSFTAMLDILSDIPSLAERDDAIILPSWENKARKRDVGSALILFFMLLSAAVLLITDIFPSTRLVRLSRKFPKWFYKKIILRIRNRNRGETE
jgi:hypothetical protein